MTTLSNRAALAIKACVATRGKAKGMILARCPKSGTDAAAAWQGIAMAVNPYKVSLGALLFMSEEHRAIFQVVHDAVAGLPKEARVALDRDRKALEAWGVW